MNVGQNNWILDRWDVITTTNVLSIAFQNFIPIFAHNLTNSYQHPPPTHYLWCVRLFMSFSPTYYPYPPELKHIRCEILEIISICDLQVYKAFIYSTSTYIVRVYNVFWGLNHKLKILIKLVPWHGTKSQRDKGHKFESQPPLKFKWNIAHHIWGGLVLHPHF